MVGFVDTHDNMKNFDQKFAGKDPGPYVGKVKFTNDPLRQGRLGVNIPDLSQTNDPGPDDCIWCQYLSPFYGAKSIEANDKSDPDSYKGTQHTYGMWFVPPDIDTEVLVIFAKGELSKKNAFWIGCVQQPLTNHRCQDTVLVPMTPYVPTGRPRIGQAGEYQLRNGFLYQLVRRTKECTHRARFYRVQTNGNTP